MPNNVTSIVSDELSNFVTEIETLKRKNTELIENLVAEVRIPEYPAGHSDNIRPPKPGYPATLI